MDDLGIEPLGIEPLNAAPQGDSLGIEPLGIEPLDAAPVAPKRAPANPNYSNEGRSRPTPYADPLDNMALRGADLAGGVLETLTTGLVQGIGQATSGGLGAVYGLANPNMTAKEGFEKGSELFKEKTPYLEPETRAGKKFEAKVGELVEKFRGYAADPEEIKLLISAIPFAGKRLSEDEALQAVVSGLGTAIPEVAMVKAIPADLGTFRVSKKAPAKVSTSQSVADILARKAEQADIRKAEAAAAQPVGTQGDLFGMDDTTGMASQYNPNQAVEPISPLRQRRQMELPLGEPGAGPMTQTPEGILNHPANRELFQARDMREEVLRQQLDQEQRARAPGELFPEDPYQGVLADQGPQLGAPPPVMPEPSRRQMGLDFRPEQPMQVTPDGQVLRGAEDPLAARAAEEAYFARRSREMEGAQQTQIDDTQHAGPGEVYGAQYGTESGVGRVDENGMPIRADLSMEAQNLQNPLQRNLWGDELGPALGQDRSLTEALDTLESTPFRGDQRDIALERLGAPTGARSFNERTRGQGGAISGDVAKKMAELGVRIVRVSNGVHAINKEGQVVGRLESNITPEQGTLLRDRFPNERNDASIDIVKVDDSLKGQGVGTALYAEWAKAHGGNVAPSGVTTQAAWNQWKRNYPSQVDLFVKGEAARLRDGANPEQLFSNIKDPDIANRIRIEAYEPGTYADPFKAQRGHIRIPGERKAAADQLKKMAIFKQNIAQLLVEDLSPEEVVERALATPDIQQNPVQKAFNFGTKGGDYMTAKTDNNVVIKQTVDPFKKAEDIASANKQEIVHNVYAPTWRKLNKDEFTRAWDALQQMSAAKQRLTDDEMVTAGLTGKERDAIKMHHEVMDVMVPKINEALDAAGLSHIDPEAAYVAAKSSGNFRRVMMKEVDGEMRVVGALGARTRQELKKQIDAFTERFPDSIPGEEQVYRGTSMRSTGFDDVMTFLSSQDPLIKEFIQRSRELNYQGSRTHLMQKKGVIGHPGNRPWEDPYTNAKEGVEAQVRYLSTMLEWAEKAKANAHVGKFLDNPALRAAQPEAVRYAERYRDMALGRNPTQWGKGVETLLNGITDSTDGWSSYLGDAATIAKKATNYKLLTLRPGYLISNLMQSVRTMPELASFLKRQGAEVEGLGIGNMFVGLLESAKTNPRGVFQGARDYADSHHVYASDLLQDSEAVRNSVSHVLASAAQKPASLIEQGTRKSMFFGFVDILHKNGVTPEEGLFQSAHKLTDMGMNRYTQQDAPLAVGAAGDLGRLPYNLLSYKFNELSRFAMLAREAFKNPTEVSAYKPVITALVAQVAFAGLSGAMFFQEADALVRMFSNLLDKPTSLTKMLLDNGDEKIVGPVTVKDLQYGGLSAATGINFSNSMGMGPVLGDTGSPANLIMPGATALGSMVGSTVNMVTSPSVTNARRFVVDALPGGGLLERQLFRQITPEGEEMGLNRNTLAAQPKRTGMDKFAKQLAMTGRNEANIKNELWENTKIEMTLADKQKSIVQKMRDEYYETGTVSRKLVDRYKKVEGNVETLDSTLQQMVLDMNIPADVRDKIKASAGTGLPAVGKMKRRFH